MHRIYVRLISRANGNGIVVLFHDTHTTTMDILGKIIEKLKSEGYMFGTLEDYVNWRWHKSRAALVAEQKWFSLMSFLREEELFSGSRFILCYCSPSATLDTIQAQLSHLQI
jgi:hypothetical protein